MAFKPSARRKAREEMGELDLTPYMNFVMILIPVIMQASEYIRLATLKIDLPSGGGASSFRQESETEEQQQTIDLAVAITSQGFTITSSQARLPIIPKVGDEYDFKALREKLWELKQQIRGRYVDDTKIIIAASLDTRYEVIVQTMDATRVYIEELEGEGEHANVRSHIMFPDVSLSPGIT